MKEITSFSPLYFVHLLSENKTIFWLTNLLDENKEKRLSLGCFLAMKLFSVLLTCKVSKFC